MEYEKQDHRPLIDEFLGKIEIFKELPSESIQLIDKRIIKKAYLKGERIMSEYEVAKGVYFVHSGIVKLTKQDEDGNELIVCIKKKGEIFAEANLFNQTGQTYPATGTMVQDGEIYFLNTDDLEQELLYSPEMAVQIIRYMSESLRDMTSILRDIALLDVYTKTVRTLERLAEKFGANHCNRMHLELPITVQEFSTLVGTSRESVSRVFSRLKKEGIIEITGRKIVIVDWCKFCSLYHQRL
ncbi:MULTISPECIES: Crp/Fnr family transcriptional regulator [Bacillales]|uniref:CarD family transcriptional regulator n=1 Tax=Sporosarcina globispora TaxID=1459 RepID=A0A0M0G882_SPOGL|nr:MULTISPECIES: Crp/Fnr family transcriptional regulator [Bacillales]KON86044.1 CarD family transcriptional regulator [Sporosarcina globispora]MBX9971612.1 Crp/Fnr family transcriptional regulator [Cytobacillus firmus]MDM5228097.1 Crp/Fnr family transcriptional regulator [Cytobacillus sp. NJ13]